MGGMYLFSRGTSRLYILASHLSPAHRYLLTTLVFGFVMTCWWFLLYRPAERILVSYACQNNSLRAECTAAIDNTRGMRALQESIDQLQTDRAVADGSRAQKPWIEAVIEVAHRAGLKITAYYADASCQKDW